MTKEADKNNKTLEEDFETISDIIDRLSEPDVEIEAAIELYSEGMKVLADSKKKLDLAKKKVIKLGKDLNEEEFRGEE